uniref:Uncharacterized protein n=1 Tax=Heterorhabditis bacteriophora TaxID=37862 RepID=A0A1I7XAE7_HETBA
MMGNDYCNVEAIFTQSPLEVDLDGDVLLHVGGGTHTGIIINKPTKLPDGLKKFISSTLIYIYILFIYSI